MTRVYDKRLSEDEEEGSDENEENELEELQTERLVFFLFKRINMWCHDALRYFLSKKQDKIIERGTLDTPTCIYMATHFYCLVQTSPLEDKSMTRKKNKSYLSSYHFIICITKF